MKDKIKGNDIIWFTVNEKNNNNEKSNIILIYKKIINIFSKSFSLKNLFHIFVQKKYIYYY
jgi:hypothetical protein